MRGRKRKLKGNWEIFDDIQTIALAESFKVGGEAGDNLRGGDQYADTCEDKEEADERYQGEEQRCACAVGGAEEV